MTDIHLENVSRRRLLQGAAGLTLALYLPVAAAAKPARAAAAAPGTAPFAPNAFLRIGEDNTVTVIAKHLEMGQGTYTGLATIVAEDLDAAVRRTDIPQRDRVHLNLDLAQRGLGSASCGPGVLPRYEVPVREYSFGFTLSAL